MHHYEALCRLTQGAMVAAILQDLLTHHVAVLLQGQQCANSRCQHSTRSRCAVTSAMPASGSFCQGGPQAASQCHTVTQWAQWMATPVLCFTTPCKAPCLSNKPHVHTVICTVIDSVVQRWLPAAALVLTSERHAIMTVAPCCGYVNRAGSRHTRVQQQSCLSGGGALEHSASSCILLLYCNSLCQRPKGHVLSALWHTAAVGQKAQS
jgi:hypothetical protein